MAQKPKGQDSSKNVLIAGLLCILLSITWFAYEFLRPLSPDEIKAQKEDAKLQAEKDRKNAKATP